MIIQYSPFLSQLIKNVLSNHEETGAGLAASKQLRAVLTEHTLEPAGQCGTLVPPLKSHRTYLGTTVLLTRLL